MDAPSFSTFPWLGLGLCSLFCITVAALAGATRWVRRSAAALKIEGAGRWNMLFRGLCLAFLIGAMTVGLPALLAAWIVMPLAVIAFTRRRDAQVAVSRRYLSRRGLANIVADVRAALRHSGGSKPWKTRPCQFRGSPCASKRVAATRNRAMGQRTRTESMSRRQPRGRREPWKTGDGPLRTLWMGSSSRSPEPVRIEG